MALQAAEISENLIGMVSVITIFVAFPIVLAHARRIWKQGANPPRLSDETAQRLVQMQQSIDAMAIELERISEGQRFVTKLMSEKQPAALEKGPISSRSGRGAD